MHSDSYFACGSSHNVCQDYALSGRAPRTGKAYALVSDGCSGSPDTDFGSRFLCRAASLLVDYVEDLSLVSVARTASNMMKEVALSSMALDATLLCAVETDKGIWVAVAGDGMVVARHKGQSYYDTHLIDFYHGYPAYLSYALESDRLKPYLTHTEGGSASVKVTLGEDDSATTSTHQFFSASGEFQAYTCFFPRDKYDLVLLLSDGVVSFQSNGTNATSKHRISVPPKAVLDELVDFKNMNGEFVVRRVKRFLQKTCVENNWTHYDDFSVAALSTG